MSMFTLNTDGGARGNPGPGAIGVVLKKDGEIIDQEGKYLGTSTNNEAEYKALILGLEKARSQNITELACFLDSELVVKQLNGEYKIKNDRLKVFFDKLTDLKMNFKKITFNYIPRTQNKEADKLVNTTLDSLS